MNLNKSLKIKIIARKMGQGVRVDGAEQGASEDQLCPTSETPALPLVHPTLPCEVTQ